MINNYSFNLDRERDVLTHGTAHYSKNWTKEDQKEYNHWYYENKTKKKLSELVYGAEHAVNDTNYNFMTGSLYAEYPVLEPVNRVTGGVDLMMMANSGSGIMAKAFNASVKHHFEEHTVAGKIYSAGKKALDSILSGVNSTINKSKFKKSRKRGQQ